MNITENITRLKASLPAGVTLVAVSKFHPVEALQEAYNAGQRVFGESRAQELTAKQKVLPSDIEWHFIDSLKLLQEVNKQAAKHDRIIRVLLEIHIAQEEAKHGFSPDECRELLYNLLPEALPYIRICGLMGMATNTDDTSLIKNEFHNIHELFTELKNSVFKGDEYFCELSMGMSHDYPIAIREGSTMIRIGTSIFGEREY